MLIFTKGGKVEKSIVPTGGLDGQEFICNAGDLGSIPELGRSPGEGNGNPQQFSCLENSMGRGAWRAIAHGVAQSWTQLKWIRTHTSLALSLRRTATLPHCDRLLAGNPARGREDPAGWDVSLGTWQTHRFGGSSTYKEFPEKVTISYNLAIGTEHKVRN